MSESPRTEMHPTSEQDRQLIRTEMTKVLKTVHFAHSRRYPALLEYIVEKTLSGRADDLKERVLGIDVFHRQPDYDTNINTVVRVTAGEVRKRLALVYHENEGEYAVQIVLSAGSYVPQFFRIANPPAPDVPLQTEPAAPLRHADEPEVHVPKPPTIQPRIRPLLPIATLAVTLGIAASISLFVKLRATHLDSVELFWQPIRASANPVVICPGALVRSADTASGMAIAGSKDEYPFTSIATTVSLAELVNLLAKDHTEYIVQPTSSTTLTKLREHPVILVGAYNNEWTERLQEDLRYRFAASPARQIYDSMDLGKTWTRPASLPLREEDDFAIISRFHSRLTGNTVVLLAGIGKNGTEAASQFVSTSRYMDLLNEQSKNWASQNIEIVLKVKVIDGKNGTPSVEAVYLW